MSRAEVARDLEQDLLKSADRTPPKSMAHPAPFDVPNSPGVPAGFAADDWSTTGEAVASEAEEGDTRQMGRMAQARLGRLTNGCTWNAVSAFANCGRAVAHVRGSYVPDSDSCAAAKRSLFDHLVGTRQ
jgi:hypothetical protein